MCSDKGSTFSSVIFKTLSGGLAVISNPTPSMQEPCAEPLSHRYGVTLTHSDRQPR